MVKREITTIKNEIRTFYRGPTDIKRIIIHYNGELHSRI